MTPTQQAAADMRDTQRAAFEALLDSLISYAHHRYIDGTAREVVLARAAVLAAFDAARCTAEQVRRDALEEAAIEAAGHGIPGHAVAGPHFTDAIARAIRALAASPAPETPRTTDERNSLGETFEEAARKVADDNLRLYRENADLKELVKRTATRTTDEAVDYDLRAEGATLYALDKNGVNYFSAFIGPNNGYRLSCEDIAAEIVRRWHATPRTMAAQPAYRPEVCGFCHYDHAAGPLCKTLGALLCTLPHVSTNAPSPAPSPRIEAEPVGESDSMLVERAVRNARHQARTKWGSVRKVFGLGSTRARELCRRFGFEPDDGADTALSSQPWFVAPPDRTPDARSTSDAAVVESQTASDVSRLENEAWSRGYTAGYNNAVLADRATRSTDSSAEAAGMERAAKWVDDRADAYDRDHGTTDPDTGTRWWPGDGEDYMCELDEIATGIRAEAAKLTTAPHTADEPRRPRWTEIQS